MPLSQCVLTITIYNYYVKFPAQFDDSGAHWIRTARTSFHFLVFAIMTMAQYQKIINLYKHSYLDPINPFTFSLFEFVS